MTPFQRMFRHVDQCATCSHASKGMCPEGERLLTEATTKTAEAMAPVPRKPADA